MKNGKYEDGDKSSSCKDRYGISEYQHERSDYLSCGAYASITDTGDTWCIYPMYDFAHPIEDAIEGVTHSICTLEFEDHRPLYDWVVS